jgi:hypothetical protein
MRCPYVRRVRAEYAYGHQLSNECPTSYYKIYDGATCQAAYKFWTGLSFAVTTYEATDMPNGCFVIASAQPPALYINTAKPGAPNGLALLLCAGALGPNPHRSALRSAYASMDACPSRICACRCGLQR